MPAFTRAFLSGISPLGEISYYIKKAETLYNSKNFDSLKTRALEDSNPRPFGP